jgi:DNA uptake protein ComE-like DNA-binding protein
MKKLLTKINDQAKAYLTFNYAERRGIMVLVVLILLTEAANALLPVIITKEPFNNEDFLADIRKFELALDCTDTLVVDTTPKAYPHKKENKKYTPYRKKAVPAPPMMIEINTADTTQLVRLSGIGPVYAGRILKYRGLLGGFYSPMQILEVFGMDSIRYAGIKDHIFADTKNINKIPVNEADFKTLLRHPYLDYETVKAICNYRDYTGPITCPDTLRMVIGYDPMFKKFRNYASYKGIYKKDEPKNNNRQDISTGTE